MKLRHTHKVMDPKQVFPCSIRELKDKFADCDIYITINNIGKYQFDLCDRRMPKIKGVIIASISINNREGYVPLGELSRAALDIYPIDREVYHSHNVDLFNTQYIDLLYDWYQEQCRSLSQFYGVKYMLIEYYNGSFILHYHEYM